VPLRDDRGIARRLEPARERDAEIRGGEGGKTINDRRQLERSERGGVHNAPV